MTGQISRLVLAIISKDTRETLERWQFDVTTEGSEEAACVLPLNHGSERWGELLQGNLRFGTRG